MKKKDFILFLLSSAFIGISQSIDGSVFNNFLNDTFHITVAQRTLLEIPREFPGFLVVFVSGLLILLGDIRIAAISNLLATLGLMGLGLISKSYGTMIMMLTVYSMGQHLYMPVQQSIGMNLADEKNMGKRLGLISGINTAAFLATSLLTAIIFKRFNVNYRVAFLVAGAAYFISAILILSMKSLKKPKGNKKLFFRKEYNLYYILSIVHGARKQIFITFGPWVLIKVFNQGVSTFAILGFIIAGIGIFFKPYLGHLIDRKGEKFVLKFEAVTLFVVCIGYAFAKPLLHVLGFGSLAIFVVCGCYIADQLMVAAGMARATYLRKIAINPDDVSPTLSMGVSIDHIVAMFIPWLGGLLWSSIGYEFVFIAGSLIAILIMFLTSKIRIDNGASTSKATVNSEV